MATPLLWLGLLTLAACVEAQDTLDVVVVDGRGIDAMNETEVSASWAALPAVQAAVEGARRHWESEDPGYEEEVRVLAVAEGAFTQPETDEHAVLYLMALWPRCCPKVGLAIVGGGEGQARLLRNVAFEGTIVGLARVLDLDGDGRDELVLRSAFGMGGDQSESVTLVALGTAGLEPWVSTGTYQGGCAAGRDDEEAVRVLATPGRSPTFVGERYTRSGCDGGPWLPAAGTDPVVFGSESGDTYVDLPVR